MMYDAFFKQDGFVNNLKFGGMIFEINRKIHLEINQTNKAASEFSLARCFRLAHLKHYST